MFLCIPLAQDLLNVLQHAHAKVAAQTANNCMQKYLTVTWDEALCSYMASGYDDWNARQICLRDRGQDKGNRERKGGRLREAGRRTERCKKKQRARGKRGRGAGITNESSLLFSQLFFLVPWEVLCTWPETLGMLNGPSLSWAHTQYEWWMNT